MKWGAGTLYLVWESESAQSLSSFPPFDPGSLMHQQGKCNCYRSVRFSSQCKSSNYYWSVSLVVERNLSPILAHLSLLKSQCGIITLLDNKINELQDYLLSIQSVIISYVYMLNSTEYVSITSWQKTTLNNHISSYLKINKTYQPLQLFIHFNPPTHNIRHTSALNYNIIPEKKNHIALKVCVHQWQCLFNKCNNKNTVCHRSTRV